MKKILLVLAVVSLNINVQSQAYKLVWSDEFNGKGAPDPEKWDYELGYIRNNELQYYTNSTKNVRQHKGNLEITVRKQKVEGHAYGTPSTFDYTSGSITTQNRFDLTYGKIEGRFKIPADQGLWACFWTLGTDITRYGWPVCGEIDIFEHINSEKIIHATAHWADTEGKRTSRGNRIEVDVTQWNVYSITWSPQSIKWFVNDIQFHEMDISEGVNNTGAFHKPHYILVNLPIGGSWPGSPDATTKLPATLYCDYIRVYEMTDTKP
jgi:beta-glucanase (GH16 family)